ncbi:MAG: MFS transporter [Pseudomonadota bacterium]
MSRLPRGPRNQSPAALSGLAAANLYIIAFAISWGLVMWVMLDEMFANRLRGAVLGVARGHRWVANFSVTMSFLPLPKAIGFADACGLHIFAAIVPCFSS